MVFDELFRSNKNMKAISLYKNYCMEYTRFKRKTMVVEVRLESVVVVG